MYSDRRIDWLIERERETETETDTEGEREREREREVYWLVDMEYGSYYQIIWYRYQ